MNDYLLYGIIALVVIIILAFIFLKVIKNKQPKQIKAGDIPVDINMIIDAVGGKVNLKETVASSSKLFKQLIRLVQFLESTLKKYQI